MSSNQSDRVIYGLIVDFFLTNKNGHSSLMEISKLLIEKQNLNFNPESIQTALNLSNYADVFDEYDVEGDYNKAFRIKPKVYETLNNYNDYLTLLDKYVVKFLGSKGYPKKRSDNIIEILLEVIFSRNIEFLKKILTVKDEIDLKDELKFNGKHEKLSRKDCQYYNELILESDDEFDEILKVIILKMFDFLSLYYNPKHKETLDKAFNGKVYYLDSSFILRLLGFDNEFREQRAIHLINILKQIDGIQFCVHSETLNEAQFRIKEIIGHSTNIINRTEKIIKSITKYIPAKESDTVQLFYRLKAQGVVNNAKDFLLYYSNINGLLRRIFSSTNYIKIEDKIKVDRTKSSQLFEKFQVTDKSKSRIKHIIRIICHIEHLRGGNNYNPFEINHWLITTDAKTLNIDHDIAENGDSPIKSVCILPTELIRTIDGVGEVTDEHIKVFKKFILKSKVFKESYSEEDIQTIEKIAAMVESTDTANHDTDTLISNLLEQTSFEDIQKRLRSISDEKEKNAALIEMFNDANEAVIETKYSGIVSNIIKKSNRDAGIIFSLFIFALPVLSLTYLIFLILNPAMEILNPLTYMDEENWGKIEGVLFLFELLIWGGFVWIYKLNKEKFVNWYSSRIVKKYK